jgi:hypothetical protein
MGGKWGGVELPPMSRLQDRNRCCGGQKPVPNRLAMISKVGAGNASKVEPKNEALRTISQMFIWMDEKR